MQNFLSELESFTGWTEDIISLFKKRVIDMAGVTNKKVKFFLDGSQIQVKDFKDYVRLYFYDQEMKYKDPILEYCRPSSKWEVYAIMSESGGFKQVSFVNSICTSRGWTHVNLLVDQICDVVRAILNKGKNKIDAKKNLIKNNIFIFVNTFIENPTFDSQVKETLTLRKSSFSKDGELPQKFIKNYNDKCGLTTAVITGNKIKMEAELGKGAKKKANEIRGIEKYEKANWANFDQKWNRRGQCSLILIEGDSAKSLAMAGIKALKLQNEYGVFPLRGKLLNVREASQKQILNNQEIKYLMQILNIEPKKKYETQKDIEDSLRYGSVTIMADQDPDGSHIKGLVMNLFHFFWPSLFQRQGFLKQFITPLLKATRKRDKVIYSFYSMPEYEQWKESIEIKNYNVKYYKGLGTSTSQEAKEYFQDIGRHIKIMSYEDQTDSEAIDLVFNKKNINKRKQWLTDYDPEQDQIDYTAERVRFKDFINKELIIFSNYDNVRSIPSAVDGLKPSQRKVLFAAMKRFVIKKKGGITIKKEEKVSNFAGYVGNTAAYHHGDKSLQDTIVGMAQTFVGSNNVNLIKGVGQFGTRYAGGKDCASARYIMCKLNKITRSIFISDDDLLLNFLDDDGQRVEPMYYVPIIPFLLVNGSEGIGTGWSTSILPHDPLDIIKWIRSKLRNLPSPELEPTYNY